MLIFILWDPRPDVTTLLVESSTLSMEENEMAAIPCSHNAESCTRNNNPPKDMQFDINVNIKLFRSTGPYREILGRQ